MSWNWIAPLVTTLAGGYLTTQANTRAAETAGNAAIQGAQITADAIREGNQQAQQTLNELRVEARPAQAQLRSVMAEPGELTPVQLARLDELRRGVTNTIHSSNFAGSGRAGAALFRRVEGDFVNQALEDNRGRAINAATTLAAPATAAASGIANLQSNTGTAVGKAMGDATSKAGLYEAQGDLASANVSGKAIGDIGALIATQGRESRYADRLNKIERSLGIG